jgi:hypothetical protein
MKLWEIVLININLSANEQNLRDSKKNQIIKNCVICKKLKIIKICQIINVPTESLHTTTDGQILPFKQILPLNQICRLTIKQRYSIFHLEFNTISHSFNLVTINTKEGMEISSAIKFTVVSSGKNQLQLHAAAGGPLNTEQDSVGKLVFKKPAKHNSWAYRKILKITLSQF